MKKICLLLLVLVFGIGCLFSCDIFDSQLTPNPDGEKKEPDNLIYNSDSELYIVLDESIPNSKINEYWEALAETLGNYPIVTDDKSEAHKHEIVIGDTDREITKTAKERLLEMKKTNPDDCGILVYSDGSSIAVVYEKDELGKTEEAVLELILREYVQSELIASKGVVSTMSFSVIGKLIEEETAAKEEKWKLFEKNLVSNGEEITKSLRSLYELYDDGIIVWMANLFNPDICVCDELYGMSECHGHELCGTAAFYYTHSARDTVGYLPNIEAMNNVWGFVTGAGLTTSAKEYFPEEIVEKMASFVYNSQDSDGYFYSPQWGKNVGDGRRGRDYDRGRGLLNAFGKAPKYPTLSDATGVSKIVTEKLGTSAVTMVSRVALAESESFVPSQLLSLAAFEKYLESLNIKTNSYSAGSVLGSQFSQIKARGEEYVDMMGDFLDANQRSDNGIWDADADYHGINGLMKISGVYSSMNREIQYADKALAAAVAAISSDENPGGIVDVWNPWVAAKNVLLNVATHKSPEEATAIRVTLYELMPEAIDCTKAKTALFKRADGSFSYLQKYATWTMQSERCGVPYTAEGDLDAAVLGVNSMLSIIVSTLDMNEYYVKLFGVYESKLFMDIITSRAPVRKAPIKHNMSEWIPDGNATCSRDGTTTSYCLDEGCDYKMDRKDVGSMGAHSVADYVANNDSTCYSSGTKTGKCSICGKTVTELNENDPPNARHVFAEIASKNTLKTEPTATIQAEYYKSCTVCGALSSESFTGEVDILANGELWSDFSYSGYTSGRPAVEDGEIVEGAYAYLSTDEGSRDTYLRFEKIGENDSLFISMKHGNLESGKTKYVYSFDFRFSGVSNDTEDGGWRIFSAKTLSGGNNKDKGKHGVNYWQNSYAYSNDVAKMKYGSVMLEPGVWYNLRYEFTVASVNDDGSVKYDIKAFINSKTMAVNQSVTSRPSEDEAPCIIFVMYESLIADNMILDIDNYSFSAR